MTLIVGEELVKFCKDNVTPFDEGKVTGVTLDVTIACEIMMEKKPPNINTIHQPVDICSGNTPSMERMYMRSGRFSYNNITIQPGEFFLARTQEVFTLPDNVTGQFSLCSSVARSGIGHSISVLIKPGFSGSLTLELKNDTQYHPLVIRSGMTIGQIAFIEHKDVGEAFTYARNGRYQGQEAVRQAVYG